MDQLQPESPAGAGWYPLPYTPSEGKAVGYWNGAEWTGVTLPAAQSGVRPRDTFGIIALWTLAGGFVLGFVAGLLSIIPAIIAAIVLGIIGFVGGRNRKYRTPQSLAALIASGSLIVVGGVLLALLVAVLSTMRI